jgi:uncharacterized protein (TIGR02246 family)
MTRVAVPLRILFVALLACALTPALIAQRTGSAADEGEIRKLVDRYMTARDAQDPSAIAALFTPDADQFTTGGEWRRGREQIRSGTAESSRRNPGVRRISIEAVRFVTGDVAIADGHYEISTGSTPARRMWTTLVLVRTRDGWRISAIRNMVPTSNR